MSADTKTGLQLRSLIKKSGELEISLANVATPEPGPDEVVVRVEAAPINPSDLGLLVGAAELSTASVRHEKAAGRYREDPRSRACERWRGGSMNRCRSETKAPASWSDRIVGCGAGADGQDRRHDRRRDVCAISLPPGERMSGAAGRHDAGRWRLLLRQSADRARHGRDHAERRPQRVGAYRGRLQPRPDAEQDLPQGRHRPRQYRAQPRAGRHPAQDRREACRAIPARPISWTTSPTRWSKPGRRLAFDAIGGGKLAGPDPDLHGGWPPTRPPRPTAVTDRHVHKQVYIYGGLDPRPTESDRAFGMAWGVGGWLLFPFLQKIGPAEGARLRQRVVDELKTTFASHYTQVVSLQEALQLRNISPSTASARPARNT